jgi:hypothetical protein
MSRIGVCGHVCCGTQGEQQCVGCLQCGVSATAHNIYTPKACAEPVHVMRRYTALLHHACCTLCLDREQNCLCCAQLKCCQIKYSWNCTVQVFSHTKKYHAYVCWNLMQVTEGQQRATDWCNICYCEELQSAPCVRLKCSHVFHK